MSSSKAPALLDAYRQVRQRSEALIVPLDAEDMVVQSMPDASPAKWHIGHTTWFFETFLLTPRLPATRVSTSASATCSTPITRPSATPAAAAAGMLTRPSLARVLAYREHVDRAMQALLEAGVDADGEALVRSGLAHEEQHQELLLMDILHLFSSRWRRPMATASLPRAGGRPAGARCAAGWSASAMAATVSPSTTKGRRIVASCRPSRSPTAW
jgi:hypothetical protein